MIINDLNLDFEKINPISGRALDKLFAKLIPKAYGRSVYYYTDLNALLNGIIVEHPKDGKEICLWATKWSHLNDTTENISGLNIIKDAVPNDVFENFEKLIDNNHSISFSLQKDFLPMWYMYGHYGSGVMLEFDADKLFHKYNYRFLRCLYKDKELYNEIAPIFFNIKYIEEWSSLSEIERTFIMAMHSSLFFSIVKNDYYQYENEVRIVGIGNSLCFDNNQTEFYRACNGTAIPYVKEYFNKSILKSVCLGPSSANRDLSEKTIKAFLCSHDINANVWSSNIPFRVF